jgi:cytochrome c-type biogenesis protein CcmE
MRPRVVVLLVLIAGSHGTGVVLEGTYGADGAFHSDTMLVKHGEEYRPPGPGETPSPAQVG